MLLLWYFLPRLWSLCFDMKPHLHPVCGSHPHRYINAHTHEHTSVQHMASDSPTHVRGFVTIIRLIGPSLLGNITHTDTHTKVSGSFQLDAAYTNQKPGGGLKVEGSQHTLWCQHLFMAYTFEKILRHLKVCSVQLSWSFYRFFSVVRINVSSYFTFRFY